jgi:prophage DNA circulation protein
VAIIRNLVVKIGADISSLSKGLGAAQNRLNKFSRSLTSIGTSLTMKVTMPLVLLAKQSLQTSAQFEQSMANAASVSGATGEELVRMTDLARHMGKTTVFSASQAADAMYYMEIYYIKLQNHCYHLNILTKRSSAILVEMV